MANYSWQTKDGYKVKVKDLTDKHLVNIIRMLRRYCEQLNSVESFKLSCAAASMRGEMAQDCLDRESFRAELIQPGERWPIYNDLMREYHKRDLYTQYPDVIPSPEESYG